MVANGVTAVRLMIGTPEQLALRDAVRAGTVIGPQLWVASPQLTGRASENAIVTTTDAEAREAVRRVKRDGYDFVKLTLFLTPPVWESIISEAAKETSGWWDTSSRRSAWLVPLPRVSSSSISTRSWKPRWPIPPR